MINSDAQNECKKDKLFDREQERNYGIVKDKKSFIFQQTEELDLQMVPKCQSEYNNLN